VALSECDEETPNKLKELQMNEVWTVPQYATAINLGHFEKVE